jgi:uncharacterized RmlC-like cupin family protein
MRKSRIALVLGLAALLGTATLAEAKRKEVVARAADALSFKDLSPQRPGVTVADVSGDHAKGAWKGFVKYPGPTKADVHTHSADAEIVVISGTFSYGDAPDAEKPYGPGSYIRIPAGVPHSNSTTEPCEIFLIMNGKYDTKPAAHAGAKK